VTESISVRDLAERRSRDGAIVVLDVREPDELIAASLPGVVHIPMDEIPQRFGELPTDRDIAVLCHSGRRSDMVARFLRANGYSRVLNVTGGIDAWSKEIDPAVPRY
jgi:rhodanese-related sulfurtransferase